MSSNKIVISSFLLGVVVASVFIAVLLPSVGIGLYASGVDASVSSSAESSLEGLSNETESEPTLKPSYRRFRNYERWAYPNKTMRLIVYMGPRFVRHHVTGQFVDMVFTAVTLGTYSTWKILAATVFIGAGETWLSRQIIREKVHNPLAEGGSSYKVWETLNYPALESETDRISDASAQYYFDWRFRTDSDDIFAIRVSATVEWWRWESTDWVYAGETKLSIVISIANYW